MAACGQKLRLFLDSDEKKQRYKLNALKNKCILFENQLLQIGMKNSTVYDFHSSRYYLQIVLFFGNKTDQPIKDFELEFRGNRNIELWTEDKPRFIRQQSQHKERVLVALFEPDTEPWLTVSFRWQALDIRSLLVPLSLVKFFSWKEQTVDNYQLHQETFKYTEESEWFRLGRKLLKNGPADLVKHLPGLKKYTDSLYYSSFDLGTQLNSMFLVLQIRKDEVKVELSANEERYLPALQQQLKFLLSD